MKDIFKDVMGIEGVHGVVMISNEGQMMLSKFADEFREEEARLDQVKWSAFINALDDATEAEFVFDRRRIYARKSLAGFLLVVLDDIAPVSMVRLNCEILQPSLDRMKTGSKLSQILKKKIF